MFFQMHKILLILSVFCLLASCNNKEADQPAKFIIEGTVCDNSCDSAQIFLVPLTEPATHETVDSVYIIDGKFRFEGTKTRIACLRLQMPQRVKFQELLVYTEPGTIYAYLAKSGSVTGTKHNDLIQEWKTVNESCIAARNAALESYNGNYQAPGYKAAYDSLQSMLGDATYKFLKSTDVNELSNFFYRNNKTKMSAEQLSDLKSHEDYYQHMLDSIRKVRAAEAQN